MSNSILAVQEPYLESYTPRSLDGATGFGLGIAFVLIIVFFLLYKTMVGMCNVR